MKRIILLMTLSVPLAALAGNSTNQLDVNKLPQPDGGVRVVPRTRMDMTEKENQVAIAEQQEMKSKGYVEQDNPHSQDLISMKYRAKIQIDANKGNTDPTDTHMKEKISDIKLAFSFKGIPLNADTSVIGYAAMGSWRDGWTGIKVFFENKNLGVCAYSLNNMLLTHGAVNISEDSARYDINKFPNVLTVTGNSNTGFTYEIEWYDNKYSKNLECANAEYSAEITKGLIEYARVIEKAV